LDTLFRLRIPTVSSIPNRCRFQVADAFQQVLKDIVSSANDELPWLRLLLFPICILHRVPSSFPSVSRNQLQTSNILCALSYWNAGSEGISALATMVQDKFTSSPSVPPLENPIPSFRISNHAISRCKLKVASGQYRLALKMLSSTGLAPHSTQTFNTLTSLHPYRPPPPTPFSHDFTPPPILCSAAQVLKCLRSFPKGTSPGSDGLRAQHILDCFRGSSSIFQQLILDSIASIATLLLSGQCPLSLAPYFSSAPITALTKKDGGVRPIAVGLIWRRLVSKLALSFVLPAAKRYLGDFQFGVGFSGGAEAIIHSVNRFVAFHSSSSDFTLAAIDFSNAFNEIDRSLIFEVVLDNFPSLLPWISFSYGQPSRLYYKDHVLFSHTGVQQGDPLGPLLFALGLHSVVTRIHRECNLSLMAWYLDDGTIIGPTVEVSKALNLLQASSSFSGLSLNIRKTKIFWPVLNNLWSDSSYFPQELCFCTDGITLLGAPVSTSIPFIEQVLSSRVAKAKESLQQLTLLEDPHMELLLLRSCLSLPKVQYTLRTTSPNLISPFIYSFDLAIRNSLENILGFGGQHFSDLHWQISGLPCRLGGVGVLHASDVVYFSFVVSLNLTFHLQDKILSLSGLDVPFPSSLDVALQTLNQLVPPVSFPMALSDATSIHDTYYQRLADRLAVEVAPDPRLSLIFSLSRRAHATDFWFTLPISGLGQTLTPSSYRLGLRYRLGLPVFHKEVLCPRCELTLLDKFGDHALHCRSRPGFKFRHDLVRDVLVSLFHEAGIKVEKEANVSFLSVQGPTTRLLRPADLLLPGWSQGRSTCVDVTGSSPFVRIQGDTFVGLDAISRAVSRKKSKHELACTRNGFAFIPFAFDTFGGFSLEAIALLSRLQRSLLDTMQTRESVVIRYVWRRLSFAIFKGIAQQLAARLPD